jgi:hypothetical protein
MVEARSGTDQPYARVCMAEFSVSSERIIRAISRIEKMDRSSARISIHRSISHVCKKMRGISDNPTSFMFITVRWTDDTSGATQKIYRDYRRASRAPKNNIKETLMAISGNVLRVKIGCGFSARLIWTYKEIIIAARMSHGKFRSDVLEIIGTLQLWSNFSSRRFDVKETACDIIDRAKCCD